MSAPTAKLLSVKEALKIIPYSREAFYRKLQCGELPSYRLGKKLMVNLEECLSAMRQSKTNDTMRN